MKKCTKCLIEKELTEFYNHKNSKDGKTEQCGACMLQHHYEYRQTDLFKDRVKSKEFKQKRKDWYKANIEERRTYNNLWSKENPEIVKKSKLKQTTKDRSQTHNYLLGKAKSNAKAKNLEINITVDDIIIPEKCPYLNILLDPQDRTRTYVPSIDRIDNSKGYIKGNIEVISALANRMKNNSSKEQLILFAKNVLNHFGLTKASNEQLKIA